MKTLLLIMLAAAGITCAAQSVHLVAGGGLGTFNGHVNNAAPVWSAGIVIDNPLGVSTGSVIGLSYRQRATSQPETLLHSVQFDILGRYTYKRWSAGAGFFFALTAGVEPTPEIKGAYTSGVGASGFLSYTLWKRLGFALRLSYDQYIGNLAAKAGEVRPQALYLSAQFQIAK